MFTSGLYEKISAETNVPKNTVKRVVESMTHVVLDTAKAGESIRIGTLGTIKPKYVKEHQANDPSKKGEKVTVPAHNKIVLQQSATTKAYLNG